MKSGNRALWLVNGILAAGFLWNLIPSHEATETEGNLSDSARVSESHYLSSNSNYLAGFSPESREALQTHWQDLGFLASRFLKNSEFEDLEDQDAMRGLIEEIGSELPSHALDFLSYYPDFPFILELENEVMQRWLNEDQSSALKHFEERGDYLTQRQAGSIVKAFSEKGEAGLNDLFAWLDGISTNDDEAENTDQQNPIVRSVIMSEISGNLDSEHLPTAVKALTERSGNVASDTALISLIPIYGEEEPAEAVAWLKESREKLPYETYVKILDGMLDTWGSGNNSHLALNFLSSEDFFLTIFKEKATGSPETVSEMERFYDLRLKAFLDASMGYFPNEAAINSKLFHDPLLRNSYFDQAIQFIPELREVTQE